MTYKIKGLRTYRVGSWIKGQFYLQGVLITFGYNLYTHRIWYEGIIDGHKNVIRGIFIISMDWTDMI